ncbi:MAG: hypothetical protein LBQ37_03625 [Elusimicrobiota bacterium]|jgi:predicted outer membrane repeat protein|nr:hypothetical protein [Elusimicrobiota bacterium]
MSILLSIISISILIPKNLFAQVDVSSFPGLAAYISVNNYNINLIGNIIWEGSLNPIASNGTIRGGAGNDSWLMSGNEIFNGFSLASKNISFVGNINFGKFFSNSGNGSVFNANLSNVNFTDGKISFASNTVNKTADDSYGGAFYVIGNSNINFERTTAGFENNRADSARNAYGGAIAISGSSKMSFVSGKVDFSSNYAKNDGGALYFFNNSNSLMSFENMEIRFSTNTAGASGGAVHALNNSILTFVNSDIIFTSNSALLTGGAMFLQSAVANFTASTITFIYNRSQSGGAVNVNNANNINNALSFNSSLVNFASNTAVNNGGAVNAWSNVNFTFNNSYINFNSNRALQGGAIYVDNVNISFNSSTVVFSKNNAAQGSDIFLTNNSNSQITFTNSRVVFLPNDEVINTMIYFQDGINGKVNFIGGAVVFQGHKNKIYFSNGSNSQILFNPNVWVFQDNANETGNSAIIDFFTVFKNIIQSNRIQMNFESLGNKAQNGGFIYLQGEGYSLSFERNALFSSNTAISDGGVAALLDASTITFSGANTNFIGNAAVRGGVFYMFNGSAFTVNNSAVNFIGNKAAYGGVIMFNNVIAGRIEIKAFFNSVSAKLSNNSAEIDGGVFYMLNTSNLMFSNSNVEFSSNIAVSSGGVIFSQGQEYSSVTMRGGQLSFLSNKAAAGGAVSIQNAASINITNTKVNFSSNSASLYGGALSAENGAVFSVSSSSIFFSSNTAQRGGAVYIVKVSSFAFDGFSAQFLSNAADIGGAIFIDASTALFRNNISVNFISNTAKTVGGAVDINNRGFLIFDNKANVVFRGNSASSGGAVNLSDSDSKIDIKNNSNAAFINNRADDGSGGAIFLNYGQKINFSGSTISFIGNTASKMGGGVYIATGSFSIINSSISLMGNTAQRGGAIYAENASVLLNGNISVEGNRALENGGAIYALKSSISFNSQNNIIFRNNTAAAYFNDIYLDSSEIYFTIGLRNDLRLESGIWAVNRSSIMFNGAGERSQIYFSGLNVFNNMSYLNLNVAGNVRVDKSSFNYINNETNLYSNSTITFTNSNVNFIVNKSSTGGALNSQQFSYISFTGSSISFVSNTASQNGGAVYLDGGQILFTNSSSVFSNNEALNGKALYVKNGTIKFLQSFVEFRDFRNYSSTSNIVYVETGAAVFNNSIINFTNNTTADDGAVFASGSAQGDISFQGISSFSAVGNSAKNGGFIYLNNQNLTLSGGAWFINNSAQEKGGAIYASNNSLLSLDAQSGVIFRQNLSNNLPNDIYLTSSSLKLSANMREIIIEGGIEAVYGSSFSYSNSSLGGRLSIGGINKFINMALFNISARSNVEVNRATFVYTSNVNPQSLNLSNANISFNQSLVQFDKNNKLSGGAIYLKDSNLTFSASSVSFSTNSAQNGGALYVDGNSALSFYNNSSIEFSYNKAQNYGGAIYADNSYVNIAAASNIVFRNNEAGGISNDIYLTNGARLNLLANSNQIRFESGIMGNLGSWIVYSNTAGGNLYIGGQNIFNAINAFEINGGSVSVVNAAWLWSGGGLLSISNTSTISFNNSNVIFSDSQKNIDNFGTIEINGGAVSILNMQNSGIININNGEVFLGDFSGQASGIVNKNNTDILTLSGDGGAFSGTFEVNSGTVTVLENAKMFGGINNLRNALLQISSGSIYYKVNIYNAGKLEHFSSYQNNSIIISSENIKFDNSANGASIRFLRAGADVKIKYILKDVLGNSNGNDLIFENAEISFGTNSYNAANINTKYTFRNSVMNLTNITNASTRTVVIPNLTVDNVSLNFGFGFRLVSGSNYEIYTDILSVPGTFTGTLNLGDNLEILEEIASQPSVSNYSATILSDNAVFTDKIETVYTGLLYSYIIRINSDRKKIDVEVLPIGDDALYLSNISAGIKTYDMKDDVYLQDPRWNVNTQTETGAGNFAISGKGLRIYSVKRSSQTGEIGQRTSLFNLVGVTTMTLTDVKISSAFTSESGAALRQVNGGAQTNIINVEFTDNESIQNGGAVNILSGIFISTSNNYLRTAFISNKSENGGAFFASGDSQSLFFSAENSNTLFRVNIASRSGGAIFINSNSSVTFTARGNDGITFLDNKANLRGGAIFVSGGGSAIFNEEKNGVIVFANNSDGSGLNDIHIEANGIVNFSGSGMVNMNSISGDGAIRKDGSGFLLLGADNSSFTGRFSQSAGTTAVLENAKVFGGIKEIQNSLLEITGAEISSMVVLNSGGRFVFYSSDSLEKTIGGQITFGQTGAQAVFAKTSSIQEKANYILSQNISAGNEIVFRDSYVKLAINSFDGNIRFENSSIDIRSTHTVAAGQRLTFGKISFEGQNTLTFGLYYDGAQNLSSDSLYSTQAGDGIISNTSVTWTAFNSYKIRGNQYYTLNGVFQNIKFLTQIESVYKAKNYTFFLTTGTTDGSIVIYARNDILDTLYIENEKSGSDRFFNLRKGSFWNLREDLSDTGGGGQFYIGHMDGGGNISGVIDEDYGGGAASFFKIINNSTILIIDGVEISSAFAGSQNSNIATKYSSGSVVFMSNALSRVEIRNTGMRNNLSNFGGGAVFAESGSISIDGGYFINNISSQGMGGAIFIGKNSNLSLNGKITFSGNKDANGLNDIYVETGGIVNIGNDAHIEVDGGIKGNIVLDIRGYFKGNVEVSTLNVLPGSTYELNNGKNAIQVNIYNTINLEGIYKIGIYKAGNKKENDILQSSGTISISSQSSVLKIYSHNAGSAENLIITISTNQKGMSFFNIEDDNNYKGMDFIGQNQISGGWGNYNFIVEQNRNKYGDDRFYGLLNIDVTGEPLAYMARSYSQRQSAQYVIDQAAGGQKEMVDQLMFMSNGSLNDIAQTLDEISGDFIAATIVSDALEDNDDIVYQKAEAGNPVSSLSNSAWGQISYNNIGIKNDESMAGEIENTARSISAGIPVFSAREKGMAGIFIKGKNSIVRRQSNKAQINGAEIGAYGAIYKPALGIDNIKMNLSAGYGDFSTERYFKTYNEEYNPKANFGANIFRGGILSEFNINDFAAINVPIKIKPYLGINSTLIISQNIKETDNGSQNAATLNIKENDYIRTSGLLGAKIEKDMASAQFYLKAGIEMLLIGNKTDSEFETKEYQMKIRGLDTDNTMMFNAGAGVNAAIGGDILVFASLNLRKSADINIIGASVGAGYSFGATDAQSKRIRAAQQEKKRRQREAINIQKRVEKQKEKERIEKEKAEKERVEEEKRQAIAKEKARIEEEKRQAAAREKERIEKEKAEKERIEEEKRQAIAKEKARIEEEKRQAAAREKVRIEREKELAKQKAKAELAKRQAEAAARASSMVDKYSASSKEETIDKIKAETVLKGNIEIVNYNESKRNPKLLKDIKADTNVIWLMVRVQLEKNKKVMWTTPIKISSNAYLDGQYRLGPNAMNLIMRKVKSLAGYKIRRIRIVKYNVNKEVKEDEEKLADMRAREFAKELYSVGFRVNRGK